MSEMAIQIRNLVKSYGELLALDSLNFDVARTECFDC